MHKDYLRIMFEERIEELKKIMNLYPQSKSSLIRKSLEINYKLLEVLYGVRKNRD